MKLDVSGLTVREFNEAFARAAAIEVGGMGGNVVVDCKMVWTNEDEIE